MTTHCARVFGSHSVSEKPGNKDLIKNLLDMMSTRYATRTWLDTLVQITRWENDTCSWNGPTTRPSGISSSHHIETISTESTYSGFPETLNDPSIFSWQKQRNNTSIWFQQKIWLECQAPLDRGKKKWEYILGRGNATISFASIFTSVVFFPLAGPVAPLTDFFL